MSAVPPSHDVGARAEPASPIGNRLKAFRLATAVIWSGLILILCWTPFNYIRQIEEKSTWFQTPDLDKAIHAGLFTILAILWLRFALPRRPIWTVMLGAFALGALSEIVQMLPIINRTAELYDLATDCVGVAVGVAIAPLVEPILRPIENVVLRRFLPCEPAPVDQ